MRSGVRCYSKALASFQSARIEKCLAVCRPCNLGFKGLSRLESTAMKCIWKRVTKLLAVRHGRTLLRSSLLFGGVRRFELAVGCQRRDWLFVVNLEERCEEGTQNTAFLPNGYLSSLLN